MEAALEKEPGVMLDIWIVILNVVSDCIVLLPAKGNVIIDDIILSFAGI